MHQLSKEQKLGTIQAILINNMKLHKNFLTLMSIILGSKMSKKFLLCKNCRESHNL